MRRVGGEGNGRREGWVEVSTEAGGAACDEDGSAFQGGEVGGVRHGG